MATVLTIQRAIVLSILAASQLCVRSAPADTSLDPLNTAATSATGIPTSSSTSFGGANVTSAVFPSASTSESSVPVPTSSFTSEAVPPGTTAIIGTVLHVPPLVPVNATTSGTAPGGFAVQPTANPAETHPFTPFPTPTETPVPGIFPPSDPLSPPGVSSDSVVIPDFNPAWTSAWEKAKAFISGFSIEEKVNFSTGVGFATGRCIGNTPPVPSDGSGPWQGLCLHDGPLGLRIADFSTGFPAGINAAATWQRHLIRERGFAMGEEYKGKGANVALGPMVNLGRVPQAGRSWEGFGPDPYLSGEAAYETIIGIQKAGVQANAKHYINNDQEHARVLSSANVDDRTQHEVYAHPFMRSVMAGVPSVMCSYNRINNTYGCENDRLMNEVLKGEFGFRGYIMSDWGAHRSTLGAIFGVDMSMPGEIALGPLDLGDIEVQGTYWGANLTAFVKNGSISEERLDDMATRIAAGWYFLHQDEGYPAVNFNRHDLFDPATNEHVDVQDDHYKIVREVGAASTVLLKNENGTLPLQKPRRITLFGLDARQQPGGPNQYGIFNEGNDGILASGWGSGTATYTYLISPLEAIQRRARKDRTTVDWLLENYDLTLAGNMAVQTDVALVFINANSGDETGVIDGNAGDRKNLTAWHNGDALVSAVAGQNRNTIVIVHSVGPIIVEPWIEHPNVTAVVWAGLGGTETGNALVDVLYGHVNPSARLPYTIAKNVSDYGAQLTLGDVDDMDFALQIPYAEKLLIDYRHFDANGIEPRFEFGFGLSYTTFEYSNLSVSEVERQSTSDSLRSAWKEGKPSPNGQGSSVALWLHEPAYKVDFTVTNTGGVAGTEIPQLYVHHPESAGEPPSVLKGFTDVYLKPGQSKTVSIMVSRHDLSVWDVVTQSWRRPNGTIELSIGASSRDLRLSGAFP